jgi:hypothetical protein
MKQIHISSRLGRAYLSLPVAARCSLYLPGLTGWVVRCAFENRARLGPLVTAQRQRLRAHEVLQLCISHRPSIGSGFGGEFENSPVGPFPKLQSEFVEVRMSFGLPNGCPYFNNSLDATPINRGPRLL